MSQYWQSLVCHNGLAVPYNLLGIVQQTLICVPWCVLHYVCINIDFNHCIWYSGTNCRELIIGS